MSAPLFTGNPHDDDPDVIDAFTRQAPEPPTPPLEPIIRVTEAPKKVATRILTGFMTLDPSWTSPVMVFPEDLNRLHVRLRADGATATDCVAVSSDPADLAVVGGIVRAGRLFTGDGEDFDDHTGPIWILPTSGIQPAAQTQIFFTWWCVTK